MGIIYSNCKKVVDLAGEMCIPVRLMMNSLGKDEITGFLVIETCLWTSLGRTEENSCQSFVNRDGRGVWAMCAGCASRWGVVGEGIRARP